MIKGSCLCEEVRYEYNGTINEIAVCHCNQCKRAQGTPLVTNAPVELEKCTFTNESGSLKAFFSNPNKKRVFCTTCGSPMYSQRMDMLGIIRLRLGTVTEGHIPEPNYEIFCESKSGWFSEDSGRPKFQLNKS